MPEQVQLSCFGNAQNGSRQEQETEKAKTILLLPFLVMNKYLTIKWLNVQFQVQPVFQLFYQRVFLHHSGQLFAAGKGHRAQVCRGLAFIKVKGDNERGIFELGLEEFGDAEFFFFHETQLYNVAAGHGDLVGRLQGQYG